MTMRRSAPARSSAGTAGPPRALRAWPLAWPSPSGPLGWQRSPMSTARARRAPALEDLVKVVTTRLIVTARVLDAVSVGV
jgi:hypothetical protein